MSGESPPEVVLAFVRGELSPASLESIGVTIRLSEEECHVHDPGLAVVQPSTRDLACGLVRNWRRRDVVRNWSRVVLAGPFIDLAALERDRDGERFLEILWELSAHGRVSEGDLEFAERIAGTC
jgi:hypothetical protein